MISAAVGRWMVITSSSSRVGSNRSRLRLSSDDTSVRTRLACDVWLQSTTCIFPSVYRGVCDVSHLSVARYDAPEGDTTVLPAVRDLWLKVLRAGDQERLPGSHDHTEARAESETEVELTMRTLLINVCSDVIVLASSERLRIARARCTVLTSGSDMASKGIIYEYEDGGKYCGEWENDAAHGHGVCTGPNGNGLFQGLWERGYQASGVFTWPSGQRYMGKWRQGVREGFGKETKPDGTEYCGEFTRDSRGPCGVLRQPNGVVYRGTWKDGVQNGEGTEVYIDGGIYVVS